MGRTLAIARLTFLLAVRNGSLWTVKILVAATAALIFFGSTGDHVLLNELKLRLQYSYALAYALLTLLIMAISCFTMRAQIDAKQIHLLTSRPVRRREIWLGKWLGLTAVAAAGELTLLATLALCAAVYCRGYDAAATAVAREAFRVAEHRSAPVPAPLRRLTEARIARRIQEGKLQRRQVTSELWKEQYEALRRADQRVAAATGKTWRFRLPRRSVRGDAVRLEYRLYARNRWTPIRGVWRVGPSDEPATFEADFEVHPADVSSLTVPLAAVPRSGVVDVTLIPDGDTDVIVSRTTGVRLYYKDTPLAVNVLKAAGCQVLHLSIAAAVGLTAGVAFTFAVAAFITSTLYVLSMSAGFFADVLKALGFGYDVGLLDRLAMAIIGAGLGLVKGLQPPPVVTDFGAAVSVPLAEIASTWLPGAVIYAAVTVALGVWLLERKELDKILT